MNLYDLIVAKKLSGGGGGGGGGSSNVVTGEFTTSSTTGAAENISIPYNGNGYPVKVHLYFIDESMDGTKAVIAYYLEKIDKNIAPTYSGTAPADSARAYYVSKYSTSDSSRCTYGNNTSTAVLMLDADAVSTGVFRLHVKNKNTLSLYKGDTQGGFLPNTKYGYIVEYSE